MSAAFQDLFQFVEGASAWYVTSGQESVIHGGNTYIPAAVSRSDFESKPEMTKMDLTLDFDMDNTVARRWLVTVLDSIVTLTVFVKDGDSSTVTQAWKGRLASVKPGMASIRLVFENVFTSLRRLGLRRRFQRNCPHVLYGRGCFVSMLAYELSSTVGTVNGVSVISTVAGSQPANYYRGGILKAADGTMRFITGHNGTNLTLIRSISTLVTGQACKLYPGCDRTRETCNTTFNNLLNNGSTPFIPIKNPFGGISFI